MWKIFTLNLSSAPSLLTPNEACNGFILVTLAGMIQRTYRITRQTTNSSGQIELDWFDFLLDLYTYQLGTLTVINIPYDSQLFGTTSVIDLAHLEVSNLSLFQGETFKLLCIDASADDPIRESPSVIDFQTTYAILSEKVQFVYYTLLDGAPVCTDCFGNIAFDGQYGFVPPIDPSKLIDVVTVNDVNYYIIHVTTTPNIITTNSVSVDSSSDVYTINGIQYILTVPGNSLTDNSFYAYLSVPSGLDPSIAKNGFELEPRRSIAGYSVNQLSDTSYKFAITPARGVTSMDLKITFVGPDF